MHIDNHIVWGIVFGLVISNAYFFKIMYASVPTLINHANDQQKPTTNKSLLFSDMNAYDTEKHEAHSGTVYQHGVWVAQTLAHWFNKRHPWVRELPTRYKRTLIFTGFLHDIGKCGDGIYAFITKPHHAHTGFCYLQGTQLYRIALWQFDFEAWLKDELNFSQHEYNIISILVAFHRHFGEDVVAKASINSNNEYLFRPYLDKLAYYAKQVNYGPLDEPLVLMSMIIAAADVKGFNQSVYYTGMFPDKYPDEWKQTIVAAHPAYEIKYDKWEYEPKGLKVKKQLLSYFRRHHTKP
jgi:hypothetical protein